MYYLGIDPGSASGAYAILDSEGSIVKVELFKGWKDSQNNILQVALLPAKLIAVLEQVSGRPGERPKAVCSFCGNYMGWQSYLETSDISYTLCTPQRWQKAILGSVPKGESKKYAVAHVSRKYGADILIPPRCRTPHEGIADAICIAEFCRTSHLQPILR